MGAFGFDQHSNEDPVRNANNSLFGSLVAKKKSKDKMRW